MDGVQSFSISSPLCGPHHFLVGPRSGRPTHPRFFPHSPLTCAWRAFCLRASSHLCLWNWNFEAKKRGIENAWGRGHACSFLCTLLPDWILLLLPLPWMCKPSSWDIRCWYKEWNIFKLFKSPMMCQTSTFSHSSMVSWSLALRFNNLNIILFLKFAAPFHLCSPSCTSSSWTLC